MLVYLKTENKNVIFYLHVFSHLPVDIHYQQVRIWCKCDSLNGLL